jgi:hypothetical protein
MTPSEQVTVALRALHVTTTLVAELKLGPRVAHQQQRALDAVIVAGASLEGLRRDLDAIARAAAKRRKARR